MPNESHLKNKTHYQSMLFLGILQNWLACAYTCMMNLPLSLLGGLWGVMYLMDVHGFSKIDATYITSMLFVGMIFGSPLVGWISDRIGSRKLPMTVGAIASLVLVSVLVWGGHLTFVPGLSMASLLVLFFHPSHGLHLAHQLLA